MGVTAIIVAGGVGKRLKSKVRKSFVRLAGRPMLGWVLRALERSPSVRQIVIVAHPGDLAAARRLARSERASKVAAVVPGGKSRMASVACGLRALPPGTRWVLVHDAARPLVTPALIEAAIQAARRAKAAIVAVPVVPTIKQARDRWVVKTLDRSTLWAVQTPQVFERKLLEEAHRRSNGFAATDDAALVEAMGKRVKIVPGSERNIKVTTPEDRMIAEALLKKS
ncbi:MAG: 2-C-methyl-D-erythritol 4-phosphate cytidylyltransferase [Candidatus Omnitrophota bacterium]|nr:2-C-methyl-D-erythritol 4-phosphate cytidylyltransferase [Candidatus Omnitrophota bacterium]